MRANVIQIGNSKGIRIPKMVIDELHIEKEVDIEIKGNSILIKPLKKKPREGWNEKFQEMAKRKEDKLLIDDKIDLNVDEWEW